MYTRFLSLRKRSKIAPPYAGTFKPLRPGPAKLDLKRRLGPGRSLSERVHHCDRDRDGNCWQPEAAAAAHSGCQCPPGRAGAAAPCGAGPGRGRDSQAWPVPAPERPGPETFTVTVFPWFIHGGSILHFNRVFMA